MPAPILVLNANAQRETGRRAQLTNIAAARAVSDIIRTTLGPRAMLKMILDAMGSVVITNDGNAILREIDVSHPAAKCMIELSRTQDQEVGDGTTSVTVLAGELLAICEPFLRRSIHPTVIVRAMFHALDHAVAYADSSLALSIDLNDPHQLEAIVKSCLATKFVTRYNELMVQIAIDAVNTVKTSSHGTATVSSTGPINAIPTSTITTAVANTIAATTTATTTTTTTTGATTTVSTAATSSLRSGDKIVVDIKNLIKIEKLPGGDITDSTVLKGVMFNKDVTSAKMRRKIENPRILLLDCPLEFRKAESQTNVEITAEEDWKKLLQVEEDYVTKLCDALLAHRPDVVITEKGVSDLALHILSKHNVSVIRRLRKTDNVRVSKACGATIVSRPEEIKAADVGTGAGLFEVSKIGDEYFTFITKCKDPKACTVLLRGGSKDVLNEVERNLQDAMAVARNVIVNPRIVPGGGAFEMAVAQFLTTKAKTVAGMEQYPYQAVAEALEVIPRTLIENCGGNVMRVLTKLRAIHADANNVDGRFWGIDGIAGVVADMREVGVWEPLVVKTQTMKTAIEAAAMLLRIDDIVSGLSKKKDHGAQGGNDGGGEEES